MTTKMIQNKRSLIAAAVGIAAVMMRSIGWQQQSEQFTGSDAPSSPLLLQIAIGINYPAMLISRWVLNSPVANPSRGYSQFVDDIAFFTAVALLWLWMALWAQHLSSAKVMSAKSLWISVPGSVGVGIFCLYRSNQLLDGLASFSTLVSRWGMKTALVGANALLWALTLTWALFLIGSAFYVAVRQVHKRRLESF